MGRYFTRFTEADPFHARFEEEDPFQARFEEDKPFETAFENVIKVADFNIYDGAYEVKPKFEEQRLETNGKQMAADVLVDAIEVASVSNQAGGRTVYIGGQINYGE